MPAEPPKLAQRAAGAPLRPVGSLDRIEITVRYNAWDIYRMEMAERWRRSHSADAPVISSSFPFAVLLYLLVNIVYISFARGAWKETVPDVALWLLIVWGAWWVVSPFFEARRAAEASLSEPPVRFVFSPEGFEMTRRDVSVQIAWPGIRRVKETWFSFLIYPRQPSPFSTTPDGRLIQVLPWMKQYFVLPIHCFADPADLRLFRSLIRKRTLPESL